MSRDDASAAVTALEGDWARRDRTNKYDSALAASGAALMQLDGAIAHVGSLLPPQPPVPAPPFFPEPSEVLRDVVDVGQQPSASNVSYEAVRVDYNHSKCDIC